MADDIAEVLGITAEPDAPEQGGQGATEVEESPTSVVETSDPSPEVAAGDEPATEPDAQKPQAKTGVEKRIAELTWKQREAERQLAEERGRREMLEKIHSGKLTADGQPAPANQPEDREPDPSEYTGGPGKDAISYQRDLIAYHVRQRATQEGQAREAQERQAEASRAQQARVDNIQRETAKAVTAGEGKWPDFRAVASQASPYVSDFMLETALEDQHAPDALYYLGKRPEEAARIAALPPLQQVREMTRLLDRIGSTRTNPKTSKAPPPIVPVGGATQQSAPKDPSKMSDDEYLAYRNAQRVAAFKRK